MSEFAVFAAMDQVLCRNKFLFIAHCSIRPTLFELWKIKYRRKVTSIGAQIRLARMNLTGLVVKMSRGNRAYRITFRTSKAPSSLFSSALWYATCPRSGFSIPVCLLSFTFFCLFTLFRLKFFINLLIFMAKN